MNPVKAGLAPSPEKWIWSSADSQQSLFPISTIREKLLKAACASPSVPSPKLDEEFEQHERTGRPMGDMAFLEKLGHLTGRDLVPKRAGRKPKKDK